MRTALLLLALVLAPACGADVPRAEVVYGTAPLPDGTSRELPQVRRAVERRLSDAGFERFEVGVLGDGQLRIVLPESQVGRVPEVRKLLEEGESLGVTLVSTSSGK